MTRKLTILLLAVGLALTACDDDASVATPAAGDDDATVAVCLGEYEERLPEYEGLSLEQAEDLADDEGMTLREVGRDGECFAITMDLRDDRVNVEVVDDIVIAAVIF